MADSSIQVAMATDDRYLDYALVAFSSLLFYHRNEDVTLHLLCSKMTERMKNKFKQLEKTAHFQLVPHQIDQAILKDWPAMRWSAAAYYRLLLPEIMPDCQKLLYIDCDVLVLDDIQKLWDIDISDYSCAAVAAKIKNEHLLKLDLKPDTPYLNSGIMLFNPSKMKESNDFSKFQKVFEQYRDKIKYPDQDILNIVYAGKWKKLPLRWNLITSVYRNPPNEALYSGLETESALQDPGIAHFTGTHKPWLLRKTYHHPYARSYRLFARLAGLS